MVISDCTVGMGITGSFCSFEKTKDVAKRLVDSFTHVTPVYSYNAQMMNTRFGKAGDFMHTISEITGDEGIRTLQEAERVGPGKLFDVMVIYPCTGNTAAKRANGSSCKKSEESHTASVRKFHGKKRRIARRNRIDLRIGLENVSRESQQMDGREYVRQIPAGRFKK